MNEVMSFGKGVTLYIPWLVLMFIHACSATCNMCLERSLLRATILIDSKQPVQPFQPNINLAAWIDARMDARFDAFEKRMDVRFQAIEDKLDKFIAEMRLSLAARCADMT